MYTAHITRHIQQGKNTTQVADATFIAGIATFIDIRIVWSCCTTNSALLEGSPTYGTFNQDFSRKVSHQVMSSNTAVKIDTDKDR